ncbi:hypothetical protein AXE65_06350 [Ventosimonas gracilis]|uniref:DUF3325 domain-containing protein n=1 Tax=Ventosimonas gracilis TaxID=1680762 RepID=A0A139SLJ1_9GAMM|nr:DUF3325 family protein [Ventosimonas gracilis]KXU35354.1 hypothetical protein AXE65_06350 [Ventosimonas gracilis]
MMVVIAVWALAFAGFTLLAADMKHKKELGSAAFSARQLLCCQVLGTGLLLLSILPCLFRWSFLATALSAWISLIGFAAITLGLLFTYAPRAIAYLKFAVGVVGIASALLLPAKAD